MDIYIPLLIPLLLTCTLCQYRESREGHLNTHGLIHGYGVLTPANIATHMAHSLVDFLAQTFVWAVIQYLDQVSCSI